jgi:hypothetical protein
MAEGGTLLTKHAARATTATETALTWIKGALGAGLTKHMSPWADVLADAIWMRRQRPCPQPEKPASRCGRSVGWMAVESAAALSRE